ncbi:DUF402 domain-containing protein [Streptomyces cavernae]|uniref:DUF402 domain-containing protein n=1 Tax=Streptomyces cavernae TaxID=2259034 RepID=UPI000FEB7344|nr:DUF402 domain-containing protein [Streptomyces cavernae]
MPANSTEKGAEFEVVLMKSGRTKIRYRAELLDDDGTRITVRAPWAGSGIRDFGFVRFEPGDIFTEHYWRDRWYAVKEVRDAEGVLKGWYCDVTRPAEVSPGEISSGEVSPGAISSRGVSSRGVSSRGISPREIVVEDLDLDLWCSADGGTVLRLDEDEFAASGLADRDPEAASAAERSLDELERLARGGHLARL